MDGWRVLTIWIHYKVNYRCFVEIMFWQGISKSIINRVGVGWAEGQVKPARIRVRIFKPTQNLKPNAGHAFNLNLTHCHPKK